MKEVKYYLLNAPPQLVRVKFIDKLIIIFPNNYWLCNSINCWISEAVPDWNVSPNKLYLPQKRDDSHPQIKPSRYRFHQNERSLGSDLFPVFNCFPRVTSRGSSTARTGDLCKRWRHEHGPFSRLTIYVWGGNNLGEWSAETRASGYWVAREPPAGLWTLDSSTN